MGTVSRRLRVVTGRPIDWQSSNDDLLEVISIPETDSAWAIARDIGSVAVTAVVDPTGFEPMLFSDEVQITPLSIHILHDETAPEDSIPNSDTRVFEVQVRDIHDSIKTGREITWQTDNGTVIAILTPPSTAGTGSVKAPALAALRRELVHGIRDRSVTDR